MLPVSHVDATRGPKGVPALVDPKTNDVLDQAGDRIGKSEPSPDLTHKLSWLIAGVTSGLSNKRLLDLRPSDVDSGKGYGLVAPDDGSLMHEPMADVASQIETVSQVIGTRYYEDPLSATKQVLPVATEAGGQVPTTQMAPIKVAYDCAMYGLAADVPAGIIAQADFNVLKGTAYRLGLALRLAREVRVANLLLTSGNWNANNVVAAAAKWNGGTTPDPMVDIFSVLNKSTLPVTDIIMSEAVLQYFVTSNAAAVLRIQNFLMAWGELEDFQGTHQFPTVRIAKMKTVSGSGATPVPSYIWQASATSANVALIRRSATTEGLSTTRTFRWTGDAGDGAVAENGYLVRKFWLEKSGARGTEGLIVVANDQEKFLSNTVGGLITGVIA